MGMRHYKGVLGEFDYDDTEFQESVIDAEGNYDGAYDGAPCLCYVGKETDGSKIKIPEGLVSGIGMFNHRYDLEMPPVIPEGLKNCAYMFQWCNNLISTPVIPEGVKDCSCMFAGCSNLESAPVIPESVTDCHGMFENCSNLKSAPVIPEGVKDCSSMFEYCSNLKSAPVIPKGVKNCCRMFAYCSNLKSAPVIPESVTDCRRIFVGCENLPADMTKVPWRQQKQEAVDKAKAAGDKSAVDQMTDYMVSHNYGIEDKHTYENDPEWQELNDMLKQESEVQSNDFDV